MHVKDVAFTVLLVLVAVSLAPGRAATADNPPTIERVSVTDDEQQANGASDDAPAISADGRFVAFTSRAQNLGPQGPDPRGVYVRDTLNGTTERIDVDDSGRPADDVTDFGVDISADGRFVVFTSRASNLVPGDTNASLDVFVRDREAGTTERASVSTVGDDLSGEAHHPVMSRNGRFVVFGVAAGSLIADRLYVRDRAAGTTALVDIRPASGSYRGSLAIAQAVTDDGGFLTLFTDAALLSIDHNGRYDAYGFDLARSRPLALNVTPSGDFGDAGSEFSSISADGRYVAFDSDASNLVPGDRNRTRDVFVRDLVGEGTTRSSVSGGGSEGNGMSTIPVISADGRHVAFRSVASNLVVGDGNGLYDVYVRDMAAGTTRRISTSAAGVEGDGHSEFAALSADGRTVAFESAAANLVPNDTNAVSDVFLTRTPVAGNPGVQFTKATGQASVLAGQAIDYTLTIDNTGDVPLTGMVISDDAAPDCAGPVPDLDAGDQTTVECSFTTAPGDVGTYTNVATLATEELPPVASNAVGVGVVAAPSLAVTASADQTDVATGDTIDLHVTVTNTGNVPLTGLVVTDDPAPDCEATLPSLAVGVTHTVDCSYTTTPADAGTYENVATVQSDQTASVTSNRVQVAVRIRRQPDLKVRRHRGPRVGDDLYGTDVTGQVVVVERPPGGMAEFFFTVQNDGHTSDRFTIDRVEVGRNGVRFFAGRSDRDITAEVLSGTYRTDPIDPGASSTIRLEVAVPRSARSGSDRRVTLTATSPRAPVVVDTARAQVHVR